MKQALVIMVALLLFGTGQYVLAGITNSPIEVLATRLADDHFWRNGTFPAIDLPKTATPDEVLAQLFKMTTFGESRITSFKILETKEVTIRGPLPDTYTAVLIDSDLGQKIVLFQHIKPHRWWTKVYDADKLPNQRLEATGETPAPQP